MFFSAGDYCIQHLADPDPAYRVGVPLPGEPDHWHQGGIRIRPRINYVGEGGTRLVWCDGIPSYSIDDGPVAHHPVAASFMSGAAPFVWNPALGTGGDFVQAVITQDVRAGDLVFTVDSIDGFEEGTPVVIRLDVVKEYTNGVENPDQPEVRWWTFAIVADTDPGDPEADPPIPPTITLDRPAQVPCDVSQPPQVDLRSHVIRKVDPDRCIEGIEIRNFEMVLAPPSARAGTPFQRSEGGLILLYARNCLVENLRSTDVGAGIVAVQYGQNNVLNRLHVRSASIAPETDETKTYYGRGLALQGVNGCRVSDLRVEHFQGEPVLVEHHSVQARLENVYIVNNHLLLEQGLVPMFASLQKSDFVVSGVTVEGFGGFPLVGYNEGPISADQSVWIEDLNLFPTRQADGDTTYAGLQVQTRWLRGSVRHDRTFPAPVTDADNGGTVVRYRYDSPRVWSKAVQLPVGDEIIVPLPDGLLRRGRIFLSCSEAASTVFEAIDWVNGPLLTDRLNLRDLLTPGGTSDLPAEVTTLGPSTRPVDNATPPPAQVPQANAFAEQPIDPAVAPPVALPVQRYLRIVTEEALPPGEYLVVQLELFPYRNPERTADSGTRDDRDGGFVQGVEPLTVSLLVDADDHVDTTIPLDQTDTAWHDIAWDLPVSGTGFLEVALAAAPGDLVRFAPSLIIAGGDATDVNFDVRCVRTSGPMVLWSGSSAAQSGFLGWRAEALAEEEAGQRRSVTGGVTYRVQPEDVVDGRVTLRMVYRLDDSDGPKKRNLIASNVQRAYVEAQNLSVP